MRYAIRLLFTIALFISCTSKELKKEKTMLTEVNKKSVSDNHLIIAHRGTTYWAPEETEPAFRWARNMGADYLELDLQLTKDNYLVAFHDNNLNRTTNIETVFPNRKQLSIHDFTLKELRSLDVGSWFNTLYPKMAKEKYQNQTVLTLQDVLYIAEGYRIKRKDNIPVKLLVNGKWNGTFEYEKDPFDNGNRPGLYIETKHPKLHVEELLAKALSKYGWNINTKPKSIQVQPNKVYIANTNNRIILQSFSPQSIKNLQKNLPNIPKCFLLWKSDMKGEFKEVYQQAIQFAIQNKVQFIGPSIAGEPNNYDELTAQWMTDLIHKAHLKVHAYTFDTKKQLSDYTNRVEAVFTNRTDLALAFYNRKNKQTPNQVLEQLGY